MNRDVSTVYKYYNFKNVISDRSINTILARGLEVLKCNIECNIR